MASGVFFQRRAATACPPDPGDVDIVRQQRSPFPRDGAALETQQRRDARVAAAPGLQRFEPGIQAPLLLVEDADTQHNRCPELLRQESRFGQRPCHAGLGTQGSAPQQWLTPAACVRRAGQHRPATCSRVTRAVRTRVRSGSLVPTCRRVSSSSTTEPRPAVSTLAAAVDRSVPELENQTSLCAHRLSSSNSATSSRVW